MSELIAVVVLTMFVACAFIFKNGPCGNCGRMWVLGWMAMNVMGYCGSRCFDEALTGTAQPTEDE